ncbi:YfcE family phosphodiesterase [Candidatus Sumerlaeota bacterium]|nr:YfcE family phosphodiesterase [Candidatus Sumerlaeota bacterium]
MSRSSHHRTAGVISDTHGRLAAEIFDIFSGVEVILHAGDVGGGDILIELGALATVHAVSGNIDGFEIRDVAPLRQVVDLGDLRVGLTHGHLHGGPSDRHRQLRQAFAGDRVDAVVYGHTHCPAADTSERPWVLNPGSASQGRGGVRSVGLLRFGGDLSQPEFEVVRLD